MAQQPIKVNSKSQRKVSNQMDKICSKLEISVKDVPDGTKLTQSAKQKIQKYIEKDQVRKLQNYLNKNVLGYEVQIGIKSMKWNIVHFAAKNNSQKTLKVILARTYQQSPQKYNQLINSQTFQGYTPLMISIINFAQNSLSLLLQLGGCDTQITDNRKMKAYDLALNYKNESAIKELMSYQSNSKKKGNLPNQELLLKPIDRQFCTQENCYTTIFDYFVDCFLCFKYGDDDFLGEVPCGDQEQVGQPSFLKKSLNNNKFMNLLKSNEQIKIDTVPIGNNQIESKYSIEWKKLTTAVNQKTVLFDCFQPFDICENNLIIANNLIIFQCLSDHTWLVRKILRQLKKGEGINSTNPSIINTVSNGDLPHQYTIEIYMKDELKKITVDQHIPFLKQREQPMFLSNNNQMWPQILQKGLAKLYGSYMRLSQVSPMTFIQNLTGSYTKSFALEDGMNYFKDERENFIKEMSIMGVLQEFTAKGYVILLEGRQNTTLSPKNSPSSFRTYCYTVLNFYQKGTKKLILVNCPYVLNSWKEKEKTQIMQLKLIKSHYNSHNQMCVWIEESQFAHFFKKIIISFTEPNMIRTQIKIRYLLETQHQSQIKSQSSKLMTVIESLTASAKNIFSSSKDCQQKQNVKRQSRASNISTLQSQVGSSNSMSLKAQKYKLINKTVFVKFKIENSRNSEYLSLTVKDYVTHRNCKINSFKGWIDGGSKDISLEQVNPFCTDLIKINQKKGEYLCMLEVEFMYFFASKEAQLTGSFKTQSSQMNQQKQNMINENRPNKIELKNRRNSLETVKKIQKYELLVVCWSEDNILLQQIEEEFAIIDCLQSWKKSTIKNWSFMDKKQNGPEGNSGLKYVTQKICNKTVVMTKWDKDVRVFWKCEQKQQMEKMIKEMVHEGHINQVKQTKRSQQKLTIEYKIEIDMISDGEHSEFKYMVLVQKQELGLKLESLAFNFQTKK